MGNNQNKTPTGLTLPQDFFTVATFGTCSGCAMITWIVTGVLSSLFHLNVGISGLIVAMVVAYMGLFLSNGRQKSQFIITFFNGFLIYATVVGATSFLPYVNQQTANVAQQTRPGLKSSLTRPWIYDRNLVSATNSLISIQQRQASTLETLDKTIATIESGLKREDRLPPGDKTTMLNQLSEGKKAIQNTKEQIKHSKVLLEHVGLRELPVG